MTDPMPTIREQLFAPLTIDAMEKRRRDTERAAVNGHSIAPAELKPERVDVAPPARRHAEDAEHLLNDAREMVDSHTHYPPPALAAAMAAAEATLALAEQQRIANVIAWQALTGESYRQDIRRDLFG